MMSPPDTAFLIIMCVEALTGVLTFTSRFVMAVNVLRWVRRKNLETCDLILFCLGLSNVVFQCFCTAYYAFTTVAPVFIYSSDTYRYLLFLILLTSISSSWITACLCVFYCVKIVDLSHPLFIRLKLRINKVVSWMLLASTLGSLVLALPVYWDSYVESPSNGMGKHYFEVCLSVTFTVVLTLFGDALPLVPGILSITLILVSLFKHTQRMKRNATEVSRPQLEALSVAARTVSCLLLLYMCFQLANLLLMVNAVPAKSPWSALCPIVVLAHPPAQSIVLILGNTKLKQASARIFCCPCSD